MNTIDLNSIRSMKKLEEIKADLKKECYAQKPEQFKYGEIIEVSDFEEWEEIPTLVRFHSFTNNVFYQINFKNGKGHYWPHARKPKDTTC